MKSAAGRWQNAEAEKAAAEGSDSLTTPAFARPLIGSSRFPSRFDPRFRSVCPTRLLPERDGMALGILGPVHGNTEG